MKYRIETLVKIKDSYKSGDCFILLESFASEKAYADELYESQQNAVKAIVSDRVYDMTVWRYTRLNMDDYASEPRDPNRMELKIESVRFTHENGVVVTEAQDDIVESYNMNGD